MTHKGAAKLLAWILAPMALFGGIVFLFLLFSLFAAPQHHGVWEGEEMGNGDWLGPYFVPSLLIYLLLGMGIWWLLISYAYASDGASPCSSTVWRLLLGFNILASIFWIFLSIHVHNDNSNGYLFCLLPLAVTIPVGIIAGRFLFKTAR